MTNAIQRSRRRRKLARMIELSIVAVGRWLLSVLLIMVLASLLHGYVSENVPALGFWQALIVEFTLTVVGSHFYKQELSR